MNENADSTTAKTGKGYDSLRQSSLTSGLSDQQCQTLAKTVEIHQLKDHEVLISEGHTDNCLYIISSGRLEVTRNVGGNEWVTLALLNPGEFAGEMGFVDGTSHSATLRATGKTEVFSLSRKALESLIDIDPHLVYELMRNIVRTVHKILTRMNQQYVEMNNYITKQHGRY